MTYVIFFLLIFLVETDIQPTILSENQSEHKKKKPKPEEDSDEDSDEEEGEANRRRPPHPRRPKFCKLNKHCQHPKIDELRGEEWHCCDFECKKLEEGDEPCLDNPQSECSCSDDLCLLN